MQSVNTGTWPVGGNHLQDAACLADDLIYGADKIAEFLFGHTKFRRRVYYLIETDRLPVMRLPGICARKSTLIRWICDQEYFAVQAAPSDKSVRVEEGTVLWDAFESTRSLLRVKPLSPFDSKQP